MQQDPLAGTQVIVEIGLEQVVAELIEKERVAADPLDAAFTHQMVLAVQVRRETAQHVTLRLLLHGGDYLDGEAGALHGRNGQIVPLV